MSRSDFATSTSKGSSRGRKFFTLAEAQRALPLVKRIVADIQGVQAGRLKLHAELSAGVADLSASKQKSLQGEFDRASDRLEKLVGELGMIGVELKDASRGLLDFPSLYEGREILLCWKGGEESITYWHELQGGYAGRKPVSALVGTL